MGGKAYDVIVVGGGHAGIEAALACARLGSRCALVTHDIHEIGRMPCNPAIGGLGKGHLVREIDVLGGEMARVIDDTGIQFRVLNRSKGPAVQSPRAQADKFAYQGRMEDIVLAQENLTVIEADVVGVVAHDGVVAGVSLDDGSDLSAPRVVLCSGTFMRGLMHVGETRTTGGREGSASSEGISGSLRNLGFELRRLKTGTPPRLRRGSIDFSRLIEQRGDENPVPFSFRTNQFNPTQVNCYQAFTTTKTHGLISAALDRSPLFQGVIEGMGPRYCPSIEDKVVRFADRDRHLLFLEPEGRKSDEIYVNGLSTSLPADVQEAVVHSIPGLDRAEIMRFGYAVEYDSVPSWQIQPTLETQKIQGLYLAGQILGTSGYEEAAAQGLLAGINAVRSLGGSSPMIIGRDVAYVGVLVDDLVTKDINEPYRMFTSRAENRLHLRCDNTESRLEEAALKIGLLKKGDQERLLARNKLVSRIRAVLAGQKVRVGDNRARISGEMALRAPGVDLRNLNGLTEGREDLLELISFEYSKLSNSGVPAHVVHGARDQAENDIRYSGYIVKHNKMLRKRSHLDNLELPGKLDYMTIRALSMEAREKLNKIRPLNLGQASRIDGVRAGDLAVLTVFMKRLSGENP